MSIITSTVRLWDKHYSRKLWKCKIRSQQRRWSMPSSKNCEQGILSAVLKMIIPIIFHVGRTSPSGKIQMPLVLYTVFIKNRAAGMLSVPLLDQPYKHVSSAISVEICTIAEHDLPQVRSNVECYIGRTRSNCSDALQVDPDCSKRRSHLS
jgi:hypothetical protein